MQRGMASRELNQSAHLHLLPAIAGGSAPAQPSAPFASWRAVARFGSGVDVSVGGSCSRATSRARGAARATFGSGRKATLFPVK